MGRDSPSNRNVPKIDIAVKLNVLVAEDNIMNQKIVRSIVEKSGHVCVCVGDGEKALEAYSKQLIDVIFMDCR
jgi:CheY-like chemotaxis protein